MCEQDTLLVPREPVQPRRNGFDLTDGGVDDGLRQVLLGSNQRCSQVLGCDFGRAHELNDPIVVASRLTR